MDLDYKKTNIFKECDEDKLDSIFAFAERYKPYLFDSKTERCAVATTKKIATLNGYSEYTFGEKLKPGDKRYFVAFNKAIFMLKVGSNNVENDGIRIMGAHIDSPRLDLKPHPLYESDGVAYLKTHYYGGIKKYQWTTIPLALYGVVITRGGQKKNICIGEDEDDPIFYVTDLLPHLSQEQNKLQITQAIVAEQLNAICGSISHKSENDDECTVKYAILKLLNDKYGMTEVDFTCSELCLVPSGRARDVGFDRSLIMSYSHDDICCAYPELMAMINSDDSPHTIVSIFADKEETGSDGITGMNSRVIYDFIQAVCDSLGANCTKTRYNSICVSCDVTSAYDPSFADVYDKKNCCFIGCGPCIQKYTGARGKNSTNDAPAEVFAKIRDIMEDNNVIWQTGELGKIDIGGGGTIAKFISYLGIPTIDMGLAVLSMHAPQEVISKADLYEMYLAMKAFCK